MFPPPRFFPDITVNFTEHILQGKPHSEVALYACAEGLTKIEPVTWGQLYRMVETCADAMRGCGVKKGDRVAAVITNCVEAIVACLAALSIGAIFSTSSPDMGATGIMDRLQQIQPRLVIVESAVTYNAKRRELITKFESCLAELVAVPNFQSMLVIDRDGSRPGRLPTGMIWWEHFNENATRRPLVYEQLPFDHIGFIVYSSGTVRLMHHKFRRYIELTLHRQELQSVLLTVLW